MIVVDHIGCGLSDKPRRYPYCLAQHVDNLTTLVRRLDLNAITLVAHDWGGAIGVGAALAEPDRFARFTLLNTAAFRSRQIPLRIRICRTPVLGPLAVQGLNAFARAALWMAVERPERMTPQVRAGLLAPYDSWGHRLAIQRFVDDIPLGPRHPSYATLLAIEQGLPTLAGRPWQFIWGMRDWCFTPAFLQRFLDFFPQAEVHRLAEAGHYVVEDAYEQIGPLVEQFLAQHPHAIHGFVRTLIMDHARPIAGKPRSIGQCAALATLLEATAAKPGNVHRGADFEDVTFPEFVAAGIAIAPVLDAAVERPVGATILAAVEATRSVTKRNTNLGTILLLAPLAAVPRTQSLAGGVAAVLGALSADDARNCYAAIRLAAPGGLGNVDQGDVAALGPPRSALGHAPGGRPRPGGSAVLRGFSPGVRLRRSLVVGGPECRHGACSMRLSTSTCA